jgi:hypothetical protein
MNPDILSAAACTAHAENKTIYNASCGEKQNLKGGDACIFFFLVENESPHVSCYMTAEFCDRPDDEGGKHL